MLSVRSMLADPVVQEQKREYSKPSVLDISTLLCSNTPSSLATKTYHSSYNNCYKNQLLPKSNQLTDSYVAREQYNAHMLSTKQQQRLHHLTFPPSPLSFYALNRLQRKSFHKHQTESQKIEQDMLHEHRRQASTSSSSVCSFSSSERTEDTASEDVSLKIKRRRASSKQLDVLNRVFERTIFPSTQLRVELGKQLGMTSRTVQIWFQNKRQAIRTKKPTGPSSVTSSRENSVLTE